MRARHRPATGEICVSYRRRGNIPACADVSGLYRHEAGYSGICVPDSSYMKASRPVQIVEGRETQRESRKDV